MELHKKIHMYPMDTFDSIDKKINKSSNSLTMF